MLLIHRSRHVRVRKIRYRFKRLDKHEQTELLSAYCVMKHGNVVWLIPR